MLTPYGSHDRAAGREGGRKEHSRACSAIFISMIVGKDWKNNIN